MNKPVTEAATEGSKAVALSEGLGVDKQKDGMTVNTMLRRIPQKWRNAQITIGNSIGDAKRVQRIALHTDASGRRVVVLYEDTITVRR